MIPPARRHTQRVYGGSIGHRPVQLPTYGMKLCGFGGEGNTNDSPDGTTTRLVDGGVPAALQNL